MTDELRKEQRDIVLHTVDKFWGTIKTKPLNVDITALEAMSKLLDVAIMLVEYEPESPV